jgi:hypothetical protein
VLEKSREEPPTRRKQVKATVTVTPTVTAGKDRGGEDLELVFVAEVEGTEIPTSFDDFEVEFEVDQDGWHVVNETDVDDSDLAKPDYVLHVKSDHYEHEWKGTRQDALDLAGWLLVEKNWHFCHRPGEPERLRSKYRHYVDGNAE